MKRMTIAEALKGNSYPGRGIIVGRTGDGRRAAAAYFIMGRSENSRNRIFVEEGEGIRTQAFDPKKLTDPSLIIYAPVRTLGNKLILSNGDQTDTIYEGMDRQLTFEQALRSRSFEPDAPHYTPRISGILHMEGRGLNYALSILKSDGGRPEGCLRFSYAYENPAAGEGRLIHTYAGDSDPLQSFEGEPRRIVIPDSLDELAKQLWTQLDEANKVSLFVRFIDLHTGKADSRIINKNVK